MELVVSDGSINTGWMPAQSVKDPSMVICLKSPAPTLTERVKNIPTPIEVILEVFISFSSLRFLAAVAKAPNPFAVRKDRSRALFARFLRLSRDYRGHADWTNWRSRFRRRFTRHGICTFRPGLTPYYF